MKDLVERTERVEGEGQTLTREAFEPTDAVRLVELALTIQVARGGSERAAQQRLMHRRVRLLVC